MQKAICKQNLGFYHLKKGEIYNFEYNHMRRIYTVLVYREDDKQMFCNWDIGGFNEMFEIIPDHKLARTMYGGN